MHVGIVPSGSCKAPEAKDNRLQVLSMLQVDHPHTEMPHVRWFDLNHLELRSSVVDTIHRIHQTAREPLGASILSNLHSPKAS